MIYSSDDPRGINAMEQARLGNYGNDYEEENWCDDCGQEHPSFLYYSTSKHRYVGCDSCIEIERQEE
jgi:hypothetical protein